MSRQGLCSQCLKPLSDEDLERKEYTGVCNIHQCHQRCFAVSDPCRVCSSRHICVFCLKSIHDPPKKKFHRKPCKCIYHHSCIPNALRYLSHGDSSPCIHCTKEAVSPFLLTKERMERLPRFNRKTVLTKNYTAASLEGGDLETRDLVTLGISLRDLVSMKVGLEAILTRFIPLPTSPGSSIVQINKAEIPTDEYYYDLRKGEKFFDGRSKIVPFYPDNHIDGKVLLREIGVGEFNIESLASWSSKHSKDNLSSLLSNYFSLSMEEIKYISSQSRTALEFNSQTMSELRQREASRKAGTSFF